MVVLDTCALIEICQPYPQLSQQTMHLIENGAFLLSISFAEIACKVKLGKLKLGMPPRELFLELSRTENLQIIDLGVEEWLNAIDLQWAENRDPADRVITAFAASKNLPLVTSDQKINGYYHQVIW